MNTYNNSLWFYKKYYRDVNWVASSEDENNAKLFQRQHELMFAHRISKSLTDNVFTYPQEAKNCFELATTYPGLLIGSGITHGSGRLGEIKIGFYFDHTTGLPVIPGSSVKGTLRSVFPMDLKELAQKKDEDENSKKAYNQQAEGRQEYLVDLLVEISGDQAWNQEGAVEHLSNWLFENDGTNSNEPTPMSGRVIFHDALPVYMVKEAFLGAEQPFLGTDFITPHKPLKNPVPIQFLKVLPGLVYRFQFQLHPYKNKELGLGLKEEDLNNLFQEILLLTGIGAKTNVGYGQFLTPADYLENFSTREEKETKHRKEAKKREAKKREEKEKLLSEIPVDQIITEMPKPGSSLVVFGRVLPLSEVEKVKESKKTKPRKRIQIFSKTGIKIGNKWDKKLWEYEADTILKVQVTFSSELRPDGVLPISSVDKVIEEIKIN